MKYIILIISLLLISLGNFAQQGAVKGKVTDASNNEPIAFANVVVLGTQTGATTDLNGNFSITGLKSGYIKLQISFVGFKPTLSQEILIANNKIPFIDIKLQAIETQLGEVVIKANPFEKRAEAPLSMQTIGLKEIESNAGSNRDISKVIQSFPGVGSTPAFRNDVIVRGGAPSENRFFLDEVEIPVLNHFSTQGASGGPVGIINADFIQSVDFYSGSFSADKYNALSSVLDFKQKEGSRDKTNFQATLGASETAFTFDGPLSKKTSYIVSVRRSYLQFLFSALELPFLPTYNDYQFKIKTDFNTKNQLTIISLGSLDHLTLNTKINNPDPSQEYILSQIPVNNQWSYTIGGVYKRFFDKGYHTLVLSRNMLDNSFYKYPDNDESLEKSLDYYSQEIENKFRYELTTRQGKWKYTLGANTEYAKYNNATTQMVYLNDSLQKFSYTTDFTMIKFGVSGQVNRDFLKNKLHFTLGLRMDGNNYNAQMSNLLNQLSPRMSLSYDLTPYTKLNLGVGRFFQQPAYTTLGFRDPAGQLVNESSARYIGANHFNLGVERRFGVKALLSIEGFYKDYFQYPINLLSGSSLANSGADYSSVAGAAPVNFSGNGRAFGLELLHRINLDKFNLLATYTYFVSEFSNLQGQYIASSWDSRHILSITGTKELKNQWRAGFKWRLVGGLPYTPYDMEKSANIDAWNAIGQPYYDYSQLNALRGGTFHQLDLRIDKNFFFDKWSLMVYLDIQNVYNFKYKTQDYVVRQKDANGNYLTTNGGTDYVLETIPNTSGTVLPTIGIMIKL